jgi:hypothetical protein
LVSHKTAKDTSLRYKSPRVAVTLLEAAAEDGAVYAGIEEKVKALVEEFVMKHGQDILRKYMAQRKITAEEGETGRSFQMLMRPYT